MKQNKWLQVISYLIPITLQVFLFNAIIAQYKQDFNTNNLPTLLQIYGLVILGGLTIISVFYGLYYVKKHKPDWLNYIESNVLKPILKSSIIIVGFLAFNMFILIIMFLAPPLRELRTDINSLLNVSFILFAINSISIIIIIFIYDALFSDGKELLENMF